MHINDVLQAIYQKHHYEYLILDKELKIIAYSDEVTQYCDSNILEICEEDIYTLIPELVGLEQELQELLDGTLKRFILPTIYKSPDRYIDLTMSRAKHNEVTDPNCSTLIILFEDVTKKRQKDQEFLQNHNEKILITQDLEDKNRQLKRLNEDMQSLVQEEIKKNRENQKLIKLQARHAQMGELIGMITHQWKQPLNIINMSCVFLQIKYNTKQLDRQLFTKKIDNILDQSSHLNQTILDFQNFFNPSLKREHFHIVDNISNILNLVKSDYTTKSITIDLKGDPKIEAYGYPNEFSQVVLALLQNSRDAFLLNPHDDMRIEITIGQQDAYSTISVKDNAGGVPEAIMPKIFDVYMTTKQEGSGLGLHISKSIIEEMMQGKITIQNKESGAEFIIAIP